MINTSPNNYKCLQPSSNYHAYKIEFILFQIAVPVVKVVGWLKAGS